MTGICEMLDYNEPTRPYTAALQSQREKVDDSAATPSARLLREMRTTGESFQQLGLRVSQLHKDYFLALHAPNDGRLAEFAAGARESLRAQAAIEAAQEDESFGQYVARYFANPSA
jgi:glutamate--cysteine ligase